MKVISHAAYSKLKRQTTVRKLRRALKDIFAEYRSRAELLDAAGIKLNARHCRNGGKASLCDDAHGALITLHQATMLSRHT